MPWLGKNRSLFVKDLTSEVSSIQPNTVETVVFDLNSFVLICPGNRIFKKIVSPSEA